MASILGRYLGPESVRRFGLVLAESGSRTFRKSLHAVVAIVKRSGEYRIAAVMGPNAFYRRPAVDWMGECGWWSREFDGCRLGGMDVDQQI